MALEKQQQKADRATVSLTEAAEELDVHSSTVRRYIREGKIPGHKAEGPHGPEWRIYREDLEAFAQGEQEVHRGLTESDSSGLTDLTEDLAQLQQTLCTRLDEISETQKALRPSEEEVQARADREKRLEEALTGNSGRIEELAREVEQHRVRAEAAEAQVRKLEKERDDLRRELETEKTKSWWQRLTGRGMRPEET